MQISNRQTYTIKSLKFLHFIAIVGPFFLLLFFISLIFTLFLNIYLLIKIRIKKKERESRTELAYIYYIFIKQLSFLVYFVSGRFSFTCEKSSNSRKLCYHHKSSNFNNDFFLNLDYKFCKNTRKQI